MYKALFELSKDRAEFVSRLFTKPRPAGLGTSSTVTEIMNAYWDTPTSNEGAYDANLAAIRDHLAKTPKLPLPAEDHEGIARVYRAFYWYGPAISYFASTSLFSVPDLATYRDLMTQGDAGGQGLSYLGSEENFAFLKDLEGRNLIVPVVGDFAGPKALRAVGAYVKDRGATVTAFYLSNVEDYIRRTMTPWTAFCSNIETFPIDDASVFVRPGNAGFVLVNGQFVPGAPHGPLGLWPIAQEVKKKNCGGG